MKKRDYATYPDGYRKLVSDMLPWYLRPAKTMMMRLLLLILKDG